MSNPIFTPEEIADIARLKRDNNWTHQELAAYLQGKPMSNQDKPAFPVEQFDHMQEIYIIQGGMSLREYAAIKLRVPNSGTDWLDAMIERSRMMDFAQFAMPEVMKEWWDNREKTSESSFDEDTDIMASDCFLMAEAMLKASKEE